jgi:hypothetical protein
MSWLSIIFWTLTCLLVVAIEIARRRRLSSLLERACAGRDWRRAFPDAPKDEIRAFLKLFVDSFALHRTHYLAFRPTDRVMDVYRAINPPGLAGADCLELETLGQLLERQYGLSLELMWRADITLGDVFSRTRTG